MTAPAASRPVTTSHNPAFASDRAEQFFTGSSTRSLSIGGVAAKTMVMIILLIAGGAWGWASATTSVSADIGGGYGNTTVTIPGGFWLASFAAFVLGILVCFNPRRGSTLGLLYAILEGYCLGAISAMFDAQTEGIVAAAILGTLAVFLAALVLYVTRLIRPTAKMAFGVTVAISGLVLLYLFVGIMSIFDFGFLYSESFRTMGIVVSVIAIVLAALSFTLDFAFIEEAVATGAPKELEWYCAYALTVTLVWLYLTFLRLLALLSRNA